jgi:shikimate dehydrogenase
MNRPLPRHLLGILGKPLGHSLSPRLHNWAFERLGFPAAYYAWEKDAEALSDFFVAVRTLPIAGLSVTIPHKRAVIPFLDGLSERAQSVGAVNTVFHADGKLLGENTDVAGFLAPLTRLADNLPQSALILGGGGVCRASLAALRELAIPTIVVAVRNVEKAQPLAADFGCTLIPWDEREAWATAMAPLLLINATPLGMTGENEALSPASQALWPRLAERPEGKSLAYDLVYAPAVTLFQREALAGGVAAIGGMAFFVAQAMEQLRLWTGEAVPENVVEQAKKLISDCIQA